MAPYEARRCTSCWRSVCARARVCVWIEEGNDYRKYRGWPAKYLASIFGKIAWQKPLVWYFLVRIDTHTGFGGFGIDDTFPNIIRHRLYFFVLSFCHTYVNPSCFFGLRTHTEEEKHSSGLGGKLEYRYSSRFRQIERFVKHTIIRVVKPLIHDTYGLTVASIG